MSDESSPQALAERVPYTAEVLERICDAYGKGLSFRRIARMEGMPARSTMETWRETHDEFRAALARARVDKGWEHARRGRRILAECKPDEGDPKTASARVQLASNRANYEKWMAECLAREDFGASMRVDSRVAVSIVVDLSALLPTTALQAEPLVLPVLARAVDVKPELPDAAR